ncbi:hypothetical protein LCGC14_1162480 [marine sediment metagenome]|uniref:Uncharacterized protein n=1 Tax=marine sediment metagenome TaxID=412755 RepID=A0A0F9LS36_9ZZZZ
MLSGKQAKRLLDNMQDADELKKIIKLQSDHLDEIAMMLTTTHSFAAFHALCKLQTKYREQIDRILTENGKQNISNDNN